MKQFDMPKKGEEIAVIHTNHGDILIRFFEDEAPKAVHNFKSLAKQGYYDGVIFHRVIPDFMIQGGDPEGTGRGGESIYGAPFEDEFSLELHNYRGALSMANAGPNTNGSQFFIVQKADLEPEYIRNMEMAEHSLGFTADVIEEYKKRGGTFWLDGRHTVFGQVLEGMDVVDKIAALPRDFRDKPKEDAIIKAVEINNY